MPVCNILKINVLQGILIWICSQTIQAVSVPASQNLSKLSEYLGVAGRRFFVILRPMTQEHGAQLFRPHTIY